MLEIKVPYTKGDPVTVKLSSSEEIIARFVSESDDNFTVEKAVILVQSQQGVGMMPWMMSAEDGEIALRKNNIIAICKSNADVAKAYMENTSSIALA